MIKKQAICIQCHNKPQIINRLISRFPAELFDFYVHVDKKSQIDSLILHAENVFFVPRVDVRWGRFSQVEATINMLYSLNEENYNYIHLISGNDYPLISPMKMYDRLKDDTHEYIDSSELNTDECTWSWRGIDRFLVWYPQWCIDRPANKVKKIIRVIYREFVLRTKLFMRKQLPVSTFYGGSQWFSLTGGSISWIKHYLQDHKEYVDFFKHALCPDELFFCTLLQLSPLKKNIADDNKRFMIWKGTSGGPVELESGDIYGAINTENFWCRKVTSLDMVQIIEDYWEDEFGV